MKVNPTIKYLPWGLKIGLQTPSGNFFHHKEDGPCEIIINDHDKTVKLAWALYDRTYSKTMDFFQDVGCTDERITYYMLKFGPVLPKKATFQDDCFLGIYTLEGWREYIQKRIHHIYQH